MAWVKILKNAPYEVSEDIKLFKAVIGPNKEGVLDLQKVEEIDTKTHIKDEVYHLCRCGKSSDAPFCDGTHAITKFNGSLHASKKPYKDRAYLQEGETIDLLDDERCAFARFCHRRDGDVWTLVDYSSENDNKEEAIKGAKACPAGRLMTITKDTLEVLDTNYDKPVIIAVNDPLKGVSAGLFLRGPITLIDDDGIEYPNANRKVLCRCGKSTNKPFCDATHVSMNYHEKRSK